MKQGDVYYQSITCPYNFYLKVPCKDNNEPLYKMVINDIQLNFL